VSNRAFQVIREESKVSNRLSCGTQSSSVVFLDLQAIATWEMASTHKPIVIASVFQELEIGRNAVSCNVPSYLTSSFFLIRRSSMKHSAVVVQMTQPNIIRTFMSMTAGSLPAACVLTEIVIRPDCYSTLKIPQTSNFGVATLASEPSRMMESEKHKTDQIDV
jgi:hypothetical protein